MRFADITGHEEEIRQLRAMVEADRVPHAIMMSGAPGLGKMALARAFVTYLHCQHPVDGDSCGHCQSCRQHASLNHPDLHYSFPIVKSKKLQREVSDDLLPQWREMLSHHPYMPWEKWLDTIEAGNSQPLIHVEESAEIIARAAMHTYSSRFKTFIIWLPEKLQPAAANKLLKVIEEPFPDTLFLLVSNDEQAVLPTIFSRTRRMELQRLDRDTLAEAVMRSHALQRDAALTIARLAEGRPARAFALASRSGESEEFRLTFQEMMRIAYQRNFLLMRNLADRTAAWGREKLIRFFDYTASQVRENFIYNLRNPHLSLMTQEEQQFSSRFSPFVNPANVERIDLEVTRARREISRNANSKVVLFDFFLLLCALLRLKPKE